MNKSKKSVKTAAKQAARKPASTKSASTKAATTKAAKTKKASVKAPAQTRSAKAAAQPARIVKMKPHEQPRTQQQDYTPGLLIVRCKEDVVSNVPDLQAAHVASIRSLTLPTAVESPFDHLVQQNLLREVRPIFSRLTQGRSLSVAPTSAAASFATSVRDSENEDLRGINLLRLSRNTDLRKVEKDLAATPGIEYVHRVPRRWISALPNDPLLNKQWGLQAINWHKVDPLPDASTIKIGVLDTGVDLTHPELANVVKAYLHDGASSLDIIGHGTHVAGIISAELNNKVGIAGVCQGDLTAWKIFTDTPDPVDGGYYVDDVMYQRALNAARNAGIKVVNLSIGGTASSPTEALLFKRLINAGCTVVAAMGNEFQQGNPIEFPAAYPGVIAVGASTKAKKRAVFSNTGKHIALVAPGQDILSTLPVATSAERGTDETNYAVWSGTSMATPHVVAAAALVLAKNPNLSPQQVLQKLTSTATKLAAMSNKPFTREYGYGLLNLQAALS